MKNQKFDWIMLTLSFSFSIVAAVICIAVMDNFAESLIGRVVWSAVFFALPLACSLIGVAIAESIAAQNYIFKKRGNRAVSVIIAVIVSAALGSGGQALYMTTKHIEHIITEKTEVMDVALILDYSSSMNKFRNTCNEAARQLIEDLPEENYIQFIPMSGKAFTESGTKLLQVREANKEKLEAAIDSADFIGGTNFNDALKAAYESLSDSRSGNEMKAVIMLTDGVSKTSIESNIKNSLKKEGIAVYTVLFDTGYDGENVLTDLVEATGGNELNPGNNADADKIADEMRGVYTSVNESDITVMNRGMLAFGSGDWSRGKLAMRTVLFILYGILATLVIYYRISATGVLTSLIFGIIAAFAADLTGNMGEAGRIIIAVIFAASFWSAFTIYRES